MIVFFTFIYSRVVEKMLATFCISARRIVGVTLQTSIIGILMCDSVFAQSNAYIKEQNLRGAVIAGLLRFTQWGESSEYVPRNICLAGSPISSKPISLNVKSKSINNVIELESEKSTSILVDKSCHVIIFGPKLDAKSTEFITSNAADHNWLTICDGCNNETSSMVVLRKSKRRIVFDINLIEAKKSHISFSSSLLELASDVRR